MASLHKWLIYGNKKNRFIFSLKYFFVWYNLSWLFLKNTFFLVAYEMLYIKFRIYLAFFNKSLSITSYCPKWFINLLTKYYCDLISMISIIRLCLIPHLKIFFSYYQKDQLFPCVFMVSKIFRMQRNCFSPRIFCKIPIAVPFFLN